MYDPDLHVFVNDDEITGRQDLWRQINPVRRESLEPVLAANGEDEGTAVGYATVVRNEQTGQFRVWYACHSDGLVRQAVSADGRKYDRQGMALAGEFRGKVDNLGLVQRGPELGPWFQDAELAGFCFFSEGPGEGQPAGL